MLQYRGTSPIHRIDWCATREPDNPSWSLRTGSSFFQGSPSELPNHSTRLLIRTIDGQIPRASMPGASFISMRQYVSECSSWPHEDLSVGAGILGLLQQGSDKPVLFGAHGGKNIAMALVEIADCPNAVPACIHRPCPERLRCRIRSQLNIFRNHLNEIRSLV